MTGLPAVCAECSRADAMLNMPAESVRLFCERVLDCVFSGDIRFAEFALGYCACLDSLSQGTVLPGDPLGSVTGAYRDVHDVSGSPRTFTDVLQAHAIEAL